MTGFVSEDVLSASLELALLVFFPDRKNVEPEI